MRVLTQRELNRATLARQLLLERKKLSPLAAIERLAGMQAQWAPAPYVGLWTRLEGFKRGTLERAVLRGDVVKPTVMRGTLHLITRRDYPTFWWALRDMPSWYEETHLQHALRLLRDARKRAPLTHSEALAWLEQTHGVLDDRDRRRIFHALRRRAHLVHAPESALWKVRAGTVVFHAYDEPEEVDILAARVEVVHRYLRAFGPSSKADIADWSGLRVRDFEHALDGLPTFAAEDGRVLFDVPRAPLPPADTPAPVRFLPKWDNLLLGYADRTRVLPAELRKQVIGKNGDVVQTVLVDGVVAATWAVEKGKVVVSPYAPLPKRVVREVDAEAARLQAWLL